MGLGKTIQTAVMLHEAREAGLTSGPVCICVPLSTLGGWERELAKWAPALEVLNYSGPKDARAMIRKWVLGVGGWVGASAGLEWVARGQCGGGPRPA